MAITLCKACEMFSTTVVSSILGFCAEQTWSAEWLLNGPGGGHLVQTTLPWACRVNTRQTAAPSDWWLLTLVSYSLLAPETSHPSTVVSASFSPLNFNAITMWGQTTLLHCKEGLILSIWTYNHSCFNELITVIIHFEQYRSIYLLLDL